MTYEQGVLLGLEGTWSVECLCCGTEDDPRPVVAHGFVTSRAAGHFITEHRLTVHTGGETVDALVIAP